jgi:integrase
MIERENYLAVKAFLRFQGEVMQRDPATILTERGWLKHLLRWADDRLLTDAAKIRPVFPQYLLTVNRGDGHGGRLSALGVESGCEYARMFFEWARLSLKAYRKIDPLWIRTIRPPRMAGEPRKEHQAVQLDTVRALLAVPVAEGDVATWRDKAAAAFLFLSGARSGAFCTLTLDCVNLAEKTITQYPTLGVRTKNRKAAVTALLDIPDLLAMVGEWDSFIRGKLPPTAPWYSVIRIQLGEQVLTADRPGKHRGIVLRDNMVKLFVKAELPPMSPHKFRHGHAVYGLKAARDMSDLKAVSMNLMHANIGTTDAIYAVLSDRDMQARIAGLGEGGRQVKQDDVEDLLRAALERLKDRKW